MGPKWFTISKEHFSQISWLISLGSIMLIYFIHKMTPYPIRNCQKVLIFRSYLSLLGIISEKQEEFRFHWYFLSSHFLPCAFQMFKCVLFSSLCNKYLHTEINSTIAVTFNPLWYISLTKHSKVVIRWPNLSPWCVFIEYLEQFIGVMGLLIIVIIQTNDEIKAYYCTSVSQEKKKKVHLYIFIFFFLQ